MLSNFKDSLNYVLASEGGFVDNPNDHGGATMKGITLETYRIFKKNTHLTANDLKKISDMEVSVIYLNGYWNACHCSNLPSGIDYCVFDFAVNAGYGRSIKTLQKAVGADVDGVLGSITLALINKFDKNSLINAFSDQKESFYKNIVERNPSQVEFFKGWMNRIEEVEKRAVKMNEKAI